MDCLQGMGWMPDDSIDLVVTSPPFNLRNTTGGGQTKSMWRGPAGQDEVIKYLREGYDCHDDEMPHDEYVEWQRTCLREMMRLVRPGGAIFYNHNWRVQGGLLQDRSDIVDGFPVRQVIIWRRGGGFNFNPGYFLPTYQVIYLIATPDFRLRRGAGRVGDIWDFRPDRENPHPTPFPVALATRCIASADAQVVLDPFMGSGTTAIAAIRAGRRWIGIEKSAAYCDMARKRIAEESRQMKMV